MRFPDSLTGSRALAGLVPADALGKRDADGITLREALTKFGGDPERLCALRARGVAAFVELHIEQGPVLEAEGLALGTVVAINGATRLAATVRGLAGHAGAVPMDLAAGRAGGSCRNDTGDRGARAQGARPRRHRRAARRRAGRDQRHSRAGALFRSIFARRATNGAAAPSPTSPTALQAIADRREASISMLAPTHEANGLCLRSPDRRRVRGGSGRARPEAVPSAVRGRPRHDGHGPALSGRHAVRALQGRRQPQSRGVDHSGGLRARARGVDAFRQGFSRLGDGALSRE